MEMFLTYERNFLRCSVKKMVLSSLLMVLAYSLSGIFDFVLAARLFGDNAMAAVNLVTPIFLVITFLSSMIGTGTIYLYSFEIGAFRPDNANKIVGQGAIFPGSGDKSDIFYNVCCSFC